MAGKEKLYTIEMQDALRAGDECLFCWLERKLEQETLEFVLGSSYMESDVREETSRQGFCRHHTRMMYDYGNTLGNAWILKSRMEAVNLGFERQIKAGGFRKGEGEQTGETAKAAEKGRTGGIWDRFFSGRGKDGNAGRDGGSGIGWLRQETGQCYICSRMETVYRRMLDTFVYLLQNDPEFGTELMESKGMCLPHFADAAEACRRKMTAAVKEQWILRLEQMMKKNLERIQEDIDWLIEKYDYRNQDADWKQSRDAVQRTMQKLTGGYPADPIFRCKK